jgi:ribose 5-phosphate isomerase B
MRRGRIAIASEHAGLRLKQMLMEALANDGHDASDIGAGFAISAAYPLIAEALAIAVAGGSYRQGILVCGTGIGMSIAANKIPGVRAALCTDIFMARMARLHNDANILCLGAWLSGERIALEIAREFLATSHEGGRHIPRLEALSQVESSHMRQPEPLAIMPEAPAKAAEWH